MGGNLKFADVEMNESENQEKKLKKSRPWDLASPNYPNATNTLK